jgi:2-phospho-L-lactate guanylyltransferase
VIVLIKDFHAAKTRLRPALDAGQRHQLAVANARLALAAARAGDRALAVCGGEPAAELALSMGVEPLLEVNPSGQNPAARLGISHALERGAASVLLLSSDLPRVDRRTVAAMLTAGRRLGRPAVLAAPAIGRGGTNALYLCPPDVIDLHFGDSSLLKFEREAAGRGVRFALHESPRLALDLDEPSDLAELGRRGGVRPQRMAG